MSNDKNRQRLGRDVGLAAVLIAAGTLMAGVSLATLVAKDNTHLAQATSPAAPGTIQGTPPLQGTPAPESSSAPAEAKPGGTRPTTPAPEPARPESQTQNDSVKPALPAAPAEKMAPPIDSGKPR